MTANHELTALQRLDAMVRGKMGGVSRSHRTTPFKLAGALGHVALDLLQERDALKDKLAESEAQVESLKLETKALTAERDVLRDAALKAERWLWDPDENQLAQFERIADEFYAATGHLRPGKDDSFDDTSSPENRKRWQDWSHGRNREVLADLRAALKGESHE